MDVTECPAVLETCHSQGSHALKRPKSFIVYFTEWHYNLQNENHDHEDLKLAIKTINSL